MDGSLNRVLFAIKMESRFSLETLGDTYLFSEMVADRKGKLGRHMSVFNWFPREEEYYSSAF